jgi:DNA-binding NtrC family response regulator
LFHRLAVLEVRLPPLSERREDIRLLVQYLVDKHRHIRQVPPTVDDALPSVLTQADLPGNVRQLENLIRRALAERPHSSVLGVQDLPSSFWEGHLSRTLGPTMRSSVSGPVYRADPNTLGPTTASPAWSALLASVDSKLFRALAVCERELLVAALNSVGGNQALAARSLGITPRSVYNIIRRHGLAERTRAIRVCKDRDGSYPLTPPRVEETSSRNE